MLNADGEAYEFGCDAALLLLRFGKLGMGCGRRMNRQTLCVTDIRQQRKQFEVVDEFPAGVGTALDAKHDHAAEAP